MTPRMGIVAVLCVGCYSPGGSPPEAASSSSSSGGDSSSSAAATSAETSTSTTTNVDSSTTAEGVTTETTEASSSDSTGAVECEDPTAIAWAQAAAGPTSERVGGADWDGAGNMVVSLHFDDAIDLTPFGGDLVDAQESEAMALDDSVVVKLDASGNLLWSTHWSGPGDEVVRQVRFSPSGGVVVAGNLGEGSAGWGSYLDGAALDDIANGVAFVALLDDATGELVWIETFASAGIESAADVFALGVDPSGDIWIAGDHTMLFGIQTTNMVPHTFGIDAFVARFDATGIVELTTGFGGGGDQRARAIAADGNGGVVVAGLFDSDFFVDGISLQPQTPSIDDLMLLRFDAVAETVWAAAYGSDGEETFARVAVDDDDNVYVGVTATDAIDFGGDELVPSGPSDGVVASFDEDGVHRWSRTIGGMQDDSIRALAIADDGGLLVGGTVRAADPGCGTIGGAEFNAGLVAALDPVSGATMWTKPLVGEDQALVDELGAAASGIGMVGRFRTMIDLGPVLAAAAELDVMIARFE